jgi:hypothetical protein
MRQCCGYYCAMIAVIAIFFYAVIIIMEVRKNQFVMFKLQYPETPEELKEYAGLTAPQVRTKMEEEADHKILALAIAIGLNVLCAVGCIVQVKVGEKKQAQIAREQERREEQ